MKNAKSGRNPMSQVGRNRAPRRRDCAGKSSNAGHCDAVEAGCYAGICGHCRRCRSNTAMPGAGRATRPYFVYPKAWMFCRMAASVASSGRLATMAPSKKVPHE